MNKLSDEIKEVYGNLNIQIKEYNKSKSNMQELVCKQDVKNRSDKFDYLNIIKIL